MRYDTVIIGGGLSALMCGIEVARAGKRVALVATGNSSLHFSSCSFGLYNAPEPLKAIETLPTVHPYAKMGAEQVAAYASRATEILNIAGIATVGSAEKNHYIATPVGGWRECWLSIEGMLTSQTGKDVDFKSATILYPEGFLDFYTQFILDSLTEMGIAVKAQAFALPEIVVRRNNPTEMRTVTVARALDKEENIRALATIISRESSEGDVVLLPAVLGLNSTDVQSRLAHMANRDVRAIPTLIPSVEGVKVERALNRALESMGGVIFMAHTAVDYKMEQGEIKSITTSKGVTITADNFVLASGSFIGGGLVAQRDCLCEPIFGADVVPNVGNQYTTRNIFEPQPFMGVGVATDNNFKVLVGGKSVENLYACGAVLSGYNPVKEGCGAGVAMTTALKVADEIINNR